MKKIITILAAMILCLNLVACGGPDPQPAIDAYNELADNYNKFVEYANADLDSYSEEDIDMLNGCADVLTDYADKMENGEEFTQEEIDEMVDMFEEFDGIIKEFIAEYEQESAE